MNFYELNNSYYEKFIITKQTMKKLKIKNIKKYLMFFNNRISEKINKILKDLNYMKIHVSNTCNLECKYCHINHGNYGSMDKIMTRNTARKLSEVIINNFNNISKITFFGGEPLLGIDAIEEICSNLNNRRRKVKNKA